MKDLIERNGSDGPPIELRSMTEADLPAVKDIVEESRLGDRLERGMDLAVIADGLADVGETLPQRAFLACLDDLPVGFSVIGLSEGDGAGDVAVFNVRGVVLPSYRRRGIGASILRESERRARARLDDVDASTVYMVTWADAWHSDAGALFNRLGLQTARHFFTMEYDRPSVSDPDVPPGYTIRVFDPERETRDAWRVIDIAFRDHWGYYGTTYESWREWYLGDWMDPGLCRVAVASDGELAGASMCYIDAEENERLGRQRGWIEDLGVLRSHRRRGLGRALLLASMRGLRARGCTHLTLGVDTHNPTGALALYRSVGFRVCSQSSIYRKRLRGPD